MEQPTQTPKTKSKIPILRWVLIGCMTFTLTLFAVRRFNAAKPQLDIKNSGATPITVVHRGNTILMAPGQTWHFRFWPGDPVTLHAGETVAAPSRTVTLERKGMESGMLSTVPVDVRVEGASNIVFEYTGVR